MNPQGDVTRGNSQLRFLAQHMYRERYNIVVILFRMTAILFQHLNPELR